MQKTMHTYLDCNICLVILKISIQSVLGFFLLVMEESSL